jgi:soluble lytic murein transglycosylase-like protein
MKRFTLVSALILAAALPVLAQNGSPYRFDNFDFANGVRVQLPAAPARRSRKDARGRKLVVSSNLSYSHSNTPLNQLTSMKLSESLDGFTTGNSDVDNLIVESGKRNAVDPILLYSIMHQESTFKQKAVSPKGARGLMQLMPGTAVRFGVTNIFDPRQNIEGGARYVRFLLNQFDGDITLALAGYNAGEGAVIKYGYRVPPYSETQEYVRRIGRRYALIRDPLTVRDASSLTREQLATVQRKESAPLTMYERSVFAIRLSDGRLQLVSQ